jgi:O-glycosyl hydrolase
MTGEIASFQKARVRNAGIIVWAAPWSPPAAMKSTNDVNCGVLLAANYQAYANYLTKYVKDFATISGTALYALSAQNEPDWDTCSAGYEGCTWTAEQLHQFVRYNLGPALQASSPGVKLMMAESFGGSLAMTNPTLNDAAAEPFVGIIGEHSYGLPGDEPHTHNAYPLAVTLGKEYWQTEYFNNHLSAYDAGMTEGINTAREIHNALTIGEFNAYHYWWMISGSVSNGGLVPQGCATAACAPKNTFCFGNFSKFIRPGYTRIDTSLIPSSGVYVSAYKNSLNGDFAIVAINANGSNTSQRFVLTGGMATTSVTPWLTDSSNSLIQQGTAAVSGGAFIYLLPASSVVTFFGNSGTVPTTPTFTPTITPIPASILLDDCEDGNNTNNLGGAWYNYVSDTSTIIPDPFVMTSPGMAASSNYCASMKGNIATGSWGGTGTNLNAGGTGVDLTGYTGVEFYAKGNGSYWFQLTQSTITGSYFGMSVDVASTTVWTKYTVLFAANLTQRYGGPGTLTLNDIIALQWASNANGAMDLQIDNVKLLLPGSTPTSTPNITATRTPSITMTFTRTASPSNTYTRTATRTPSASAFASSSATFTRTPSPTFTRTATPTFTNASTFTRTASPSPTTTGTFTRTGTPSFTATITLTTAPSNTNTPGNSSTFTRTSTYTPTSSFTMTSTVTPTYTRTTSPTRTVTPSFTFTITLTRAPSNTNTAGNTSTFTRTPTFTATSSVSVSASATASMSQTSSYTRTSTATSSASASVSPLNTNTFTRTPTSSVQPTSTSSVSPSNTYTITPSWTMTCTRTSTATLTESPDLSPTESATGTPPTPTHTPTITLFETELPTDTITPTDTGTATNTRTSSLTETATYTTTPSASITLTLSLTIIVPSSTPTRTPTLFATPTATPQGTATRTSSIVPSVTTSRSATNTNTNTQVNTSTRTATTVFTPTLTLTSNPTSTSTRTPAAVPTPTAIAAETKPLEITGFTAYPNPYISGSPGGLNFYFKTNRVIKSYSLDIYTPAYRLIRRENKQGISLVGDCVINIPARILGNCASGTYYCILKAAGNDPSAGEAKSRPIIIVILR